MAVCCRELAKITAARLPTALYSILSDAACMLFSNQKDLNSPPKDHDVSRNLTDPLQWLLFGDDPVAVLASFENQKMPSNFCGKVFKNGEPAYFCKCVCY